MKRASKPVDSVSRTLVQDLLGRAVLQVHLDDGQAALDYFFASEKPALPQLILLDLNLPKVDGWQVLQKIKESAYAVVPVVILSSSSNPEDVAKSTAMHANSYVSKPARLAGYVDLAHDLSAYWLGWNELGGRRPSG